MARVGDAFKIQEQSWAVGVEMKIDVFGVEVGLKVCFKRHDKLTELTAQKCNATRTFPLRIDDVIASITAFQFCLPYCKSHVVVGSASGQIVGGKAGIKGNLEVSSLLGETVKRQERSRWSS